MKSFDLAICTFVAALLMSSPTFAATVVFNETLDTTTSQVGHYPTSFGWIGGVPEPFLNDYNELQLSEGDTYEFTINFLGAQTLTFYNLNSVHMMSFSQSNNHTTSTGTISFLNAAGQSILTSTPKTTTEINHIGSNFLESDFTDGLPDHLTFSGLHYSGTVNDIITPEVTSNIYWSSGLLFSVSPVPEPETYVMLLAGLGFIGFMARRRNQNIQC